MVGSGLKRVNMSYCNGLAGKVYFPAWKGKERGGKPRMDTNRHEWEFSVWRYRSKSCGTIGVS
jgi:hypothetical protein